jgi:alpha-tubulin suppressor-like RCC1 family protein
MDPGQADGGRIPEPNRIIALAGRNLLALGFRHTCVKDVNRILCWGLDDFRQCGNKTNHLCTPLAAPCAAQPIEVSGISGTLGLGLGKRHTCAIAEGSNVACWGASEAGQSGVIAPTGCSNDACAVDTYSVEQLNDVIRLALGSAHSCALTASGFVYCWGSNSAGQMGIDAIGGAAAVPLQVLDFYDNPLADIVDIAANADFTCALSSAGRVYCWGLWMTDPIVAKATEVPL